MNWNELLGDCSRCTLKPLVSHSARAATIVAICLPKQPSWEYAIAAIIRELLPGVGSSSLCVNSFHVAVKRAHALFVAVE